jgi:alkylated DNA nucleotide flippase Atl1
VPWHRVIRYTREVAQPIDDTFLTRAEIRAWLDDGSDEGERILVRADRFDSGALTADFLVERTLDVEAGMVHLTKLHVPWGRVLEYERVPVTAQVPSRPD